MSHMYPHTVTLFKAGSENDYGEVEYTRHVIKGVRYEGRQGAMRSMGGDMSTDRALIIIPNKNRSSNFALSEGDIVIKGDVPMPENNRPDRLSDAHVITFIDEFSRNTSRISHWEVGAK